MNVVQGRRQGTIRLYDKIGGRRLFEMDIKKPLDEDFEYEDDSTNEESFIMLEVVIVPLVVMMRYMWHSF